ncbi:MAG: NUDIX domain-containing protein [Minisyncoccia bacterium]|jgi:dATP pyrophosphohydrolase
MSNRLPVIIQSIVYRRKEQKIEVLLLKRNATRGGFWNVVNGTLELEESAIDCRTRELFEEAGIRDVMRWSDEIHRFSFSYHDDIFVVVVFAASVNEDQAVAINEEHTEYRWIGIDEASQLLKFDDDRISLKKFREKLEGGQL